MKKFYLCYFDILGQSDVLKAIPADAYSMPKLTRVKCQLVRRMSKQIIRDLSVAIKDWCGRHKEWNGVAGISQFSDSFLVYVEDCSAGGELFNELLIEVACIYWEMQCKALSIRGVVAHGDAVLISEGCLCGPVCDSIEKIEKEYAQYSRIVFVRVGDWSRDLNCVKFDGGWTLDVFSETVRKRCGRSAMKCGNRTLAEEIELARTNPDVLRKHIKTLNMHAACGALEAESGDKSMVVDADRIGSFDPYPRLRPEDYIIAYLKVEKVLDVKDGRYTGFCAQGHDAEIAELVQKLVLHFLGYLKAVKKSPDEVFEKTLKENFAFSVDEFRNDTSELRFGVQQIGSHLMVWVKDDRLSALFAFAYAMGELSLSLYEYLEKGVFVRGAVSYGAGWELEDGGLYGPVIPQAYNDFKKDKFSFRVVIDDRAADELLQNNLLSRYSEGQHPLFAKDAFDNRWFVNFGSRCMRERTCEFDKSGSSMRLCGENWIWWSSAVGRIRAFVERCKASNDGVTEKVARLYSCLCEFVETNRFSV